MSTGASRVIIKKDGTVIFPGLDYEGRKLTVHERQGDILIVHVTGGSGWGGIGMRSYAPASFDVIRLIGKGQRSTYLGNDGEQYAIENIVSFEIKKQKKQEESNARSVRTRR